MIELDSLSNGGKIRFADCVGPIVQKFEFLKYPSKPEEFDAENGIRFESGKSEGFVIDSLVLYSGAIAVDTLASTETSKQLCLAMLDWANSDLGISFNVRMIRRWAYISHVVFRSEISLIAEQSLAVKELARKTSAVTQEIFSIEYEPSQIWVGHDPMARSTTIASLMIQHRGGTLYKDNVFFSEAPLPTDLHIQFLQEFERDVMDTMK
jgi:hypothetical protein